MKNLNVYLGLALAAGFVFTVPLVTHAQTTQNTMTDQGSMTDNSVAAIDGNCPVCLMKGQIMKGSDKYMSMYMGKKYMFDSMQDKDTFDKDPGMYTKDLDMKYKQMMMKK